MHASCAPEVEHFVGLTCPRRGSERPGPRQKGNDAIDSDRKLRHKLVQRLNVEITALTRMTATTLPDDEMNRRLDELFTAVGRLAHAPALNAADIDVKLTILCRHLREHLDPDDRSAVLR